MSTCDFLTQICQIRLLRILFPMMTHRGYFKSWPNQRCTHFTLLFTFFGLNAHRQSFFLENSTETIMFDQFIYILLLATVLISLDTFITMCHQKKRKKRQLKNNISGGFAFLLKGWLHKAWGPRATKSEECL